MGRKVRLRKDTDDETVFWCAGGVRILREEVWVNEKEEVVRYNLAFLLPHIFAADNGAFLATTTLTASTSATSWARSNRSSFTNIQQPRCTSIGKRKLYEEATRRRNEDEDIRRWI
jgi:hypothetical protein